MTKQAEEQIPVHMKHWSSCGISGKGAERWDMRKRY
nr:MAG TPA: hypothetical protein [Caudoviricetes sp.]